MPARPKIKLDELRNIGWRLWDPIGVGAPGGVWPEIGEDEYDSYLLIAAGMLYRGKTRQDVSAYLLQVASSHMGLSVVDPYAAIATADAIADYINSLMGNTGQLH